MTVFLVDLGQQVPLLEEIRYEEYLGTMFGCLCMKHYCDVIPGDSKGQTAILLFRRHRATGCRKVCLQG